MSKADCVAVDIGNPDGAVLATFAKPTKFLLKLAPVIVPLTVRLFKVLAPKLLNYFLKRNYLKHSMFH